MQIKLKSDGVVVFTWACVTESHLCSILSSCLSQPCSRRHTNSSHFGCLSYLSGLGVSNKLMSWTRCVWLGVWKCAVLVCLQEQGWETLAC